VRSPGAVNLTGETIKAVEIPLLPTSRCPNAIALAYAACVVLILVWVKISVYNFLVSIPKFTKSFSSNVAEILVDNAVFCLPTLDAF